MTEKHYQKRQAYRPEAVYDGIGRREAVTMGNLMKLYIKMMRLDKGLNSHKVFAAWDEVSGAGNRTIGRRFSNGTLYCSLSSAVLRSELKFRLEDIRRQINERLVADELFIRTGNDPEPVKGIVLK